jgi:hypothetical protein
MQGCRHVGGYDGKVPGLGANAAAHGFSASVQFATITALQPYKFYAVEGTENGLPKCFNVTAESAAVNQ